MLRTARIFGTAVILAALFRLSAQVSEAWGHEQVQGYPVALGVVCVLFFVRAAATEATRKDVPVGQRDILWGLSLGAGISALQRLLS